MRVMNTALNHHDRAEDVVRAIAERLADPQAVATRALAAHNVIDGVPPTPTWRPISLSDGHPGVALLFAELGRDDPAARRSAHQHLSSAFAARPGRIRTSLYDGMVALAFAGHAAANAGGGYAAMLRELDVQIAAAARRRAAYDRVRICAGQPAGSWQAYDVISGPTGVGRYLLARCVAGHEPRTWPALMDLLGCLIGWAVANDVTVDGETYPAWWVNERIGELTVDHVNLGMAHGVAGPLALLAAAWRAGVRLARHDEAIERLVTLLDRWRGRDIHGPLWSGLVPRPGRTAGARPATGGRDGWCYGAVGIARSLYLAGEALGRTDWRHGADRALRAALSASHDGLIYDYTLCHGWSGLLAVTLTMAAATGDIWYANQADSLAAKVLQGFEPDTDFGYREHRPGATQPLDRPGFIAGAAGIALALHRYARDSRPQDLWTTALLIS